VLAFVPGGGSIGPHAEQNKIRGMASEWDVTVANKPSDVDGF
jgi:hypothetical protein